MTDMVAAFQALLQGGHKEAAVEVPFDPAVRWSLAAQSLRPGRRGFRVSASLNGAAFDSAVVRRSGRFWLLVPDAAARAAGARIGDTTSVVLAPAAPTPQPPDHGRA